MEIIKMEMMYQEFIAQRGDYLKRNIQMMKVNGRAMLHGRMI